VLAQVPACLCLAFLLPVISAQSSNQAIPQEMQDLIQRQINWDANSPSEKNPNGLYFQFSKTDETTSSGKRVVLYRAYVFGAPENKKYTLTVWKLGSDPHVLPNQVYVNAKGLLMTHKPSPEQENSDFVGDSELHITVQAARAEPVRYALTSSDKALIVYGTVVPFPFTDTDRACQLEARLAYSDAKAVLIYADGLPANAEIPFRMLSAGNLETGKFKVNAQGRVVEARVLSTDGNDKGTLKVSLSSADCSVAVEIPWGEGSYHQM
jgi:hypothetical protein